MAQPRKLIADVAAKVPPPKPAVDAEQVTQSQTGDVLEARSTSRRIKHRRGSAAAHRSRHDPLRGGSQRGHASGSVPAGDGDGGTSVTELHRVCVRLKPRRRAHDALRSSQGMIDVGQASHRGAAGRKVARHGETLTACGRCWLCPTRTSGPTRGRKTTGGP
jgi:hypothetical protein